MAAADVRIAFVGALTGPLAATGRDQRDGFLLAGLSLKVLELDDAGDTRTAKKIAERLLADRIAFVTGFTSSATALALHQRLKGKPVLLISSGGGPVALAGAECARLFFSTAPSEDAIHANAGAIARLRRYKSVSLVAAPEQRATVEAALRTEFSGEVRPLAATGREEALAEIRSNPPHAIYLALEGEPALSFMRAYESSGLYHRIPLIASAVEPPMLRRLGADFAGLVVSVRWAAGLESERSRQFADSFERRYGRTPSSYAMQGYEAALALGQALRSADPTSVASVAAALSNSAFEGVAGRVSFGGNGFAKSDWRAWEVFNESSGAPYLVARERTLREYSGARAGQCRAR